MNMDYKEGRGDYYRAAARLESDSDKRAVPPTNRETLEQAQRMIQGVASDLVVGPTAVGYLNQAYSQLHNALQHVLSEDEKYPPRDLRDKPSGVPPEEWL